MTVRSDKIVMAQSPIDHSGVSILEPTLLNSYHGKRATQRHRGLGADKAHRQMEPTGEERAFTGLTVFDLSIVCEHKLMAHGTSHNRVDKRNALPLHYSTVWEVSHDQSLFTTQHHDDED